MQLPSHFAEIIPESKMPDAVNWWVSLGENTRAEVNRLYKEGTQSARPAMIVTELEMQPAHQKVSLILSDELDDHEFPNREFYEYLVNNEIYLDFRGPVHHVCTSSKAIRKYLLLGFLPVNFHCPAKGCVMKSIPKLERKNAFWVTERERF